MATDPYVDSILGDWKFDPKKSKKELFTWERKAKVNLHRDHAQTWTNPDTYKTQKVYGEVVLKETKVIAKQTSNMQLFRSLDLTERSTVEDMIA